MRCPKCRQKMMPIEGRVEVNIGEVVLTTTTDCWRCSPCDVNLAQLQIKVTPLIKEVAATKEEEHHA